METARRPAHGGRTSHAGREMTRAMIETRGLTKTFRARGKMVEAVRGVDLDVQAGQIFGLLEPNGGGKATTVRMLATLLLPSGGSARVVRFDLLRQAAEVRRRIGYVSQKGGAHDLSTGDENLLLQGKLYGMTNTAVRKRAKELIDVLDLAPFASRLVRTYSGGQRRRLDMAMGMIHRPALLCLDEPTTGLDPQSGKGVRADGVLRAQDFVRELHAHEGSMQLYVERGEEVLPVVLRLLDSAGLTVSTVTLARPTLDDVFLRLTGRSLRETAQSA